MDMKGAFDHVSRGQLITLMIKLRIDGDLVMWTGFFLLDQNIQLVIYRHDKEKKEIETEICQGYPVSPILFLIYISCIFNKVSKTNFLVISLLFVDDLGFIALDSLVKRVLKIVGKVA